MRTTLMITACLFILMVMPIAAQSTEDSTQATAGKLLVVGTAHLDTQWRWTVKESIEEYIPDTFRRNMKLMDIYPDYVFSFEGAFRYMLMDEYYPDEFAKVRPYIESGQWRVTGSWVDAVDVNIPSFESLVRHTLYGNGYFKKEFGKSSRDIFLPDCFGFGYAMPSIAWHCGLESFSTQKLTWGSWVGTPFDIGIWKGIDGSSIVCAINPGSYGSEIKDDLSRDTTWIKAAKKLGDETGLYAAYKYFGTGDTGGSPDSASVAWLDKSIKSDGPLQVVSAGADDVVDLVKSIDRDKLPVYDGELIMTRHGSGCYTSQAAMKRWNRKNEQLADAAERAAVISNLYGGQSYPHDMLRNTWIRFIWHQFHDDLTGTSIPEAYEYSWSDEILCLNRFASILENAVQTSAGILDTRVKGVPLVVYNPLAIQREDIVEATVKIPGVKDKYIRAFYGNNEVLCDVVEAYKDSVRIRFSADVPPIGYAVYDIRTSDKPCRLTSELSVSTNRLENAKYIVLINSKGEVSSIFDKAESKELLAAPLRYEILEDTPNRWPAWEVDFDDIMADPLDVFVGAPEIQIVENGVTTVAVQVTQKTENSVLKTIIRLAAGGDRVEFETDIDWYEREKMLKVALTAATPNENATYDIGLGAIERGVNFDKRYEVPGQQWADLTAADKSYGVALLNDCRYGWDHPTENKLRLTLIHTPGIAEGWDWVGDERSQDNGHHTLTYAVQGHKGDWRDGNVIQQAARLNQPLTAYQTSVHKGLLDTQTYSLIEPLGNSAVMISAVKMAEASDEIIVRVRELHGEVQDNVIIAFDRPVVSAREVNGQEEEIGAAEVKDGSLHFSLTPFQPKAFAVTLESPAPLLKSLESKPLALDYNIDGISTDANRCDGDFDGHGNTLSGDLISEKMKYLDIPFVFGPKDDGQLNAVKCAGQTVALDKGKFNHLYLLAASVDGPATVTFTVDKKPFEINLQDYAEPIGRWNSRMSDGEMVDSPESICPAYINRLPVAWYGSHRHTAECENDIYRFSYLFLIDLAIPERAKTVTLPNNDRIRVMAATQVATPFAPTLPAQPLYDETHNSIVRIAADSSSFAGMSKIRLTSPIPASTIYYTLDGSKPTASSALYSDPITVNSTTTINARAIAANYNNDYMASKTVYKIGLRDAVEVGDLVNGLACNYYETEWEKMPDFDSAEVISSFIAETVNIPETARDEDYGLTFEGYLFVPADGVYALSINSDDGSRLIVSDTLLVDNDGLHGDYEMTGIIGLKAGYHKYIAQMFQCKGGEALGASIEGPTLEKQNIPANLFFHKK